MRTRYRNGDDITLHCGCDGCSPCIVNGVLLHETGCPDAWRDYKAECKECGTEFFPEERGEKFCSPRCAAAFNGFWGGCMCAVCRGETDEETCDEE